MCELLWSDPQAMDGRSPSKRGVGVAFGPDVTRRFLEANGLQLLVRSHEACPASGARQQGACQLMPETHTGLCAQGSAAAWPRAKPEGSQPHPTAHRDLMMTSLCWVAQHISGACSHASLVYA